MNLDSPARLDPAIRPDLWRRLRSTDDEDFFDAWLAVQCATTPGTQVGVVVRRAAVAGGADRYAPVALWPRREARVQVLADLIENAMADNVGLIEVLPAAEPGSRRWYGIAFPIAVDDRVEAVAALAVAAGGVDELEPLMGRLQWGAAGLEARLRVIAMERARAYGERMAAAHDLLASVLVEEGYRAASARLIGDVARLHGCDRVSLGYLHKGRAKVSLLSHSAQFSDRMELIRLIGAAMDEAVDQRRLLIFPHASEQEPTILRAHAELAKRAGSGSILTVPLFSRGAYRAAVTLERIEARPFTQEEAAAAEDVLALATAALEEKRLNDRWLIVKAWHAAHRQLERLLGPGRVARKLVVAFLVATTVFFATYTTEYRLAADAVLEGAVQRAATVPYDGYLLSAPARAGDIVAADQVLASLDDRDLQLERFKWASQRAQLASQLQEAQGARDRAKINIIRAQIEQADAELALVDSKLARSDIKAPFEGVIVSGDLSQKLGTSLTQGDVLFQVAPLAAYRVKLAVEERRIADVAVGQEGRLLLSALPDQTFPLRVTKLTPVTVAEDGGTYFQVEATLTGAAAQLRPGMEGIAKVEVDRRLLIAIWARDVVEWLRLRWWVLWG